ncbi:MAG: hypothetical protein JWP15_900, partial [Alphaproteobacteria bacterium]|nr:hypothetical protein [Alphaproteobacteria bacterium]
GEQERAGQECADWKHARKHQNTVLWGTDIQKAERSGLSRNIRTI